MDVDTLDPAARSVRMATVKARDTKPELRVRRMVHALGYRYRLHDKRLPGTPDLVFASRRRVIFVHGCFWHRHDAPACKLARLPKTKLDFWLPKLQGNRDRDLRHQAELTATGWRHMVVWECQLRHKEHLENSVREFLDQRSSE